MTTAANNGRTTQLHFSVWPVTLRGVSCEADLLACDASPFDWLSVRHPCAQLFSRSAAGPSSLCSSLHQIKPICQYFSSSQHCYFFYGYANGPPLRSLPTEWVCCALLLFLILILTCTVALVPELLRKVLPPIWFSSLLLVDQYFRINTAKTIWYQSFDIICTEYMK